MMQTANGQQRDPLDLVIECTISVRTGDDHMLGKVAETICLPLALQASQLHFTDGLVSFSLRNGPLARLQRKVTAELNKRSQDSVATRLDMPHPDWELKPEPEEEKYLRKLLDHFDREMRIAEED